VSIGLLLPRVGGYLALGFTGTLLGREESDLSELAVCRDLCSPVLFNFPWGRHGQRDGIGQPKVTTGIRKQWPPCLEPSPRMIVLEDGASPLLGGKHLAHFVPDIRGLLRTRDFPFLNKESDPRIQEVACLRPSHRPYALSLWLAFGNQR
jgi:hypothetical protein